MKLETNAEGDKQVIIFDTTLRDGEQSPGASMRVEEKVKVAHQLSTLGVNVIEAGFPVISEGDFEAVSRIANEIEGPTICALARAVDKDIDAAGKALANAKRSRIHVFIATSEVHMKHKLNMTKEQVILKAVGAVKKAKAMCDEVEFSAEDAARTEIPFLVQVLEAVIDAGATVVNIPDTVGYTTPTEFGEIIRTIKSQVKNINKAIISVHCHNDLGLATANSLAAIENGADQVECTVNGIGERSGNGALEEIVMALKVRKDFYNRFTTVESTQLVRSSKLITETTGIRVQPNKAIVGENSFAHEAGIHQHGVLKHRETYEIMRAEDVGFASNELVIGKHSGRHAIRSWLDQNAIKLAEREIDELAEKIKTLCDYKKQLTDQDIHQLINNEQKSASYYMGVNQFMGTKRW